MTASELLTKDGYIVYTCIQVYREGVFVEGGLRKHPLGQQTATLLIISPPSAMACYHLDTDPAWEERDLMAINVAKVLCLRIGFYFNIMLCILLFFPHAFLVVVCCSQVVIDFVNHISQK